MGHRVGRGPTKRTRRDARASGPFDHGQELARSGAPERPIGMDIVRVVDRAISAPNGGSWATAVTRATTDTVIVGVQDSEVCWMGGISQDDRRFLRISVPSRQATRADAGRCVDAILAAVGSAR